jgi:hypothetical protein
LAVLRLELPNVSMPLRGMNADGDATEIFLSLLYSHLVTSVVLPNPVEAEIRVNLRAKPKPYHVNVPTR